MLSESEINAVIEEQSRYSAARRSKTCIVRTDEPELRKLWLKQKFASFEYHEQLLRIHEAWLALIYRCLARPEVQRDYPALYRFFMGPAKKNFDAVGKPGQLDPAKWEPGRHAGYARSIADYDDGRQNALSQTETWDWMPESEQVRMYPLWGAMSRMVTNIRRTVDETWFSPPRGHDDDLLNEEDTGPIGWPPNWRGEVAGTLNASFDVATDRLKAGQPAYQAGLWQAIDPSAKQVRLQTGDPAPQLNSGYGITIWQRIGD
jgi:hypothetical protein